MEKIIDEINEINEEYYQYIEEIPEGYNHESTKTRTTLTIINGINTRKTTTAAGTNEALALKIMENIDQDLTLSETDTDENWHLLIGGRVVGAVMITTHEDIENDIDE